MDLNEINESWEMYAPTLAAIRKENPFLIPSGYFESMAEQIQSQITINQLDTDTAILEIPESYFDNLEERISATIKLEELKDVTASKIFTIPENYFDSFEARISSRIKAEDNKDKQPKIRSIFTTWATYAAAACITTLIGVGIYLNTKSNNIESQFAQLPSDEIVSYLQLYSDAGDAPIIIKSLDNKIEYSDINSEVSDQEIIKYLELNL